MRRWSYILQEAVVGLRRNLSMTVAVVLSVAVSLMLFGASVLLRQQVDMATDEWTDKIEVSIFLCDGRECAAITPEQQEELRADLEDNPLVEQVFYESKEDAYRRFLERFEGQEDFTRGVTADQLPASFRVKLEDPNRFASIRQEYEARPGVEDIIDQRELLEQFLEDRRRRSLVAPLGISIVAMLAATLLVANTVRVAAFARREQTQVMKLVGASQLVRPPALRARRGARRPVRGAGGLGHAGRRGARADRLPQRPHPVRARSSTAWTWSRCGRGWSCPPWRSPASRRWWPCGASWTSSQRSSPRLQGSTPTTGGSCSWMVRLWLVLMVLRSTVSNVE